MYSHFRRVLVLAGVAAIAVLHGCASDPSGPDSDPDPDPDPGPDPNPQVTGVSITSPSNMLDVGTTLKLQAVVQPLSAPQGVTWSVSDTHIASVDASGLVSGLNPGPVTVTATSVANPARSATIQLNCNCPTPRIGTVPASTNTTWQDWIPSMECVDYVVNTSVTVAGGVLTIEPGVVAAFEASRMLRISSTGGISAAGTAQEPIILTGVQPTRGYWGGVYLDASGHASNQISHTTIEYAGIASLSGSIRRANLIVSTTSNNEALNRSVRRIAEDYLAGREITPELLNQIEVGIRAYDPCLSCATHALGMMPLVVTIEDEQGEVISQATR